MTALRLESTKGIVLLNLNNVGGALLTKTDDGVEFIALTMIAGTNVNAIICLAQDELKLDDSDITFSHVIAIDSDDYSDFYQVINDIERSM